MGVWIQLRQHKNIEKQGKLRHFQAGDWVEVGRMDARRWIADGSAWVPQQSLGQLMPADCGVLVWGGGGVTDAALGPYVDQVEHEPGDNLHLPWSYTLLWRPSGGKVDHRLLPVGFSLLRSWQIALPLSSYDQLACHVGSGEDQERTRVVVRDLRVPLYYSDFMFVKRCGDTERLLSAWKEERGGDDRLAFLRALYRVKPLVLALPIDWRCQHVG